MILEELLNNIENLSYSTIHKVLEENDIFVIFASNTKGMIKAYRTNGNKEQTDYKSTKRRALIDLIAIILGKEKDNGAILDR